ncbi:hypothetical protein EP47_02570, partial [Legionella norrlandica]
SLSLLLAIDMGEYLSRVDALNPAGLHDTDNKVQYDNWDSIKKKPKTVIQKQGNDPVSLFGVWKKEWEIIHVKPPKDKQGPNLFCDHFLNYAGFPETEFRYVSAEKENNKRKVRNFWIYSLGRGALYYLAFAPYTYVIRPAINYISDKWPLLVLGVFPLLTIATLTGLTIAGILPAAALIGALAIFAISGGLLYLPFAWSNSDALEKPIGDEVFDVSPRSNVLVNNQTNLARLHHPSIPRNSTMDIYENETTVDLTYKEINTYYKVMRCLVKQKEFLPAENKPEKRFDGLSKRDVLIQKLPIPTYS